MAWNKTELLAKARELHSQQVKWRRHFNQNPELSDREFKTTEFINNILKKEKIKTIPLKGMATGTAALIEGKNPNGKTAALRTDIDALPIVEQNKIPFKSKNEGVMHACGHDVHMSIMLGATLLLNQMRDDLGGTIKVFFQPAEEMPPGGADQMIKAGVLKNPDVDMIFGLHVDPTLPVKQFSLRDGPTMASVTDFDITVKGVTGHAAVPHRAVDAIVAAAELIESIQKIASREVNPMENAVITFGTISGGTARNVIADTVFMKGTARTLSPETLKKLPNLIRRTAAGIAKARGAKIDINFVANYPVLVNHASANRILGESMKELFGGGSIKDTPTTMGGEDFAYFLQKIPGAMFRLGVKNSKIGADKSWHSPQFMVDEDAIYFGTAIMIDAVKRFLNGKKT